MRRARPASGLRAVAVPFRLRPLLYSNVRSSQGVAMSADADHEVIDSPEALFRHLYEEHGVEEARDLLWTLNSLAVHDLLVLRLGWSPERFRDWLAAALARELLPG